MDIAEAISNFLFHCQFEKNLTERTIKAYRIDLSQFRDFLQSANGNMSIESVDKTIIRGYVKRLSEQYSPKSEKRKIACIKAFFTYLEFEDLIVINPFRKMKISIKLPYTLPEVLSIREVECIFQKIYGIKEKYRKKGMEGQYKRSIRDIAVLELLFATEMRVGELCGLRPGDVNLEDGYVRILGKGRKERIVPLCVFEVVSALREYKTLYKDEIIEGGAFFVNRLKKPLSTQSVRFMVARYGFLAGIKKKITPHTFRHSFATLLLEEGVDIKYIQTLLGHSSIVITELYTHVNDGKAREILEQFHPRKEMRVKTGEGKH